MCLIILAIGQHPDYPLILAANRDEFHARPTQDAHWWPDRPDVLGGRDLQAGGTWLAVHRNGRFATVTNFRDAKPASPDKRSRGELVTGFVAGDLAPGDYLKAISENDYAGFNLIVGSGTEFAYLSNREDGSRTLEQGMYGLSNALLDGPWDKVERSRRKLAALLAADTINEPALFRLMNDRDKGPVEEVERGRLDFETAHAITAPFIVMEHYGTRSTSVLLIDSEGNWRFAERRYNSEGTATGESRFSFRPD